MNGITLRGVRLGPWYPLPSQSRRHPVASPSSEDDEGKSPTQDILFQVRSKVRAGGVTKFGFVSQKLKIVDFSTYYTNVYTQRSRNHLYYCSSIYHDQKSSNCHQILTHCSVPSKKIPNTTSFYNGLHIPWAPPLCYVYPCHDQQWFLIKKKYTSTLI